MSLCSKLFSWPNLSLSLWYNTINVFLIEMVLTDIEPFSVTTAGSRKLTHSDMGLSLEAV